jgi:23S rRNA pseudouridine1911/1915/1917 synthase
VDVVFEDDELVVVNKAAGMVVHPRGQWTGTLVNALMGRGNELAESGDSDRAGTRPSTWTRTRPDCCSSPNGPRHRVLSRAIAERV